MASEDFNKGGEADIVSFFLSAYVDRLFNLHNKLFTDGFEIAVASGFSRLADERFTEILNADTEDTNAHPILHLIHHDEGPKLKSAVLSCKSRVEAAALAARTVERVRAKAERMLSEEAHLGGNVVKFPERGRVAV